MGVPGTPALQELRQAAIHPLPVAAASSEPLRWPWVSSSLGTGGAEPIRSADLPGVGPAPVPVPPYQHLSEVTADSKRSRVLHTPPCAGWPCQRRVVT